jgi:hypothetical protein
MITNQSTILTYMIQVRLFTVCHRMPAKGTTTGLRRRWLDTIATGFSVIGRNASNREIELWLKSPDGTALWSKFADELPPLGTLRNYFTTARQSTTDDDRPWSIGQTIYGDAGQVVDSEALPLLMLVWQRALAGGRTITVRQARWISRLRSFVTVQPPSDGVALEEWVRILYGLAATYAAREQIAEREGNTEGPDTSDLDASLAFGMLHAIDLDRGLGAAAALRAATKLGLVRDPEHAEQGVAWIDDAHASSLRQLADTVAVGEQYDQRKAGRISQLPFWKVIALMMGLRSLANDKAWDALPEMDQRKRAKALRDSVELGDWNEYAELTGIDYTPIRTNGG